MSPAVIVDPRTPPLRLRHRLHYRLLRLTALRATLRPGTAAVHASVRMSVCADSRRLDPIRDPTSSQPPSTSSRIGRDIRAWVHRLCSHGVRCASPIRVVCTRWLIVCIYVQINFLSSTCGLCLVACSCDATAAEPVVSVFASSHSIFIACLV